MKNILLVFFLFNFSFLFSFEKKKNEDSILKELNNFCFNDSLKFHNKCYDIISTYEYNSNYKLSLKAILKLIDYENQFGLTNNKKNIQYCINAQKIAFFHKDFNHYYFFKCKRISQEKIDSNNKIRQLRKILKICKNKDLILAEVEAYYQISKIKIENGVNLIEANLLLKKAYIISDKYALLNQKIDVLNLMAILESYQGLKLDSKKHFQQALYLCGNNDELIIRKIKLLLNLIDACSFLKEYELSINYGLNAIEISRENKMVHILRSAELRLAYTYLELKEYSKSMNYCEIIFENNELMNEQDNLSLLILSGLNSIYLNDNTKIIFFSKEITGVR